MLITFSKGDGSMEVEEGSIVKQSGQNRSC